MLHLNRRGSHHTFRRQVTQETRRVSSLSSASNRGILLHRYVRLDLVYKTTFHEMNIAKQIPVLRHRMFVLNEMDINMCLNICWTGDALSYLVSSCSDAGCMELLCLCIVGQPPRLQFPTELLLLWQTAVVVAASAAAAAGCPRAFPSSLAPFPGCT